MPGSVFGNLFRLCTFGESHGTAIGGIIEGCPAGLAVDVNFIQKQLNRRKPGQSSLVSPRQEDDKVEVLSGIFEGITTGAPIGFLIPNKDQRPKDYESFRNTFRPSHADFTFTEKYGHRDHRGGGRSSARETASRIVGGAVAMLLLQEKNIKINAFVGAVGNVRTTKNFVDLDFEKIEDSVVRCPDPEAAGKMVELIEEVRSSGDSVGGMITCVIQNVPPGLGEPVFDKLHADLGKAMLSINAVKGFEIGSGFKAVTMRGSEHNDAFEFVEDKVVTKTNHSGGIQGGISNGENIYFNVAFKPVATIEKIQNTVTRSGDKIQLEGKGRHDPCVVPRAVPIVEAMAALVIADHYLRNKVSKL